MLCLYVSYDAQAFSRIVVLVKLKETMKKKCPLIVDELEVEIGGKGLSDIEPDKENLIFDGRHDFLIDSTRVKVLVEISFRNVRYLYGGEVKSGIRRTVEVVFWDSTDMREVKTVEVKVCMSRYQDSMIKLVEMPLSYTDINDRHIYNVLIRDRSTGEVLYNTEVHMYDTIVISDRPERWYRPFSGYFTTDTNIERCISAYVGAWYYIHFELEADFPLLLPVVPEVEVRVYFPDGTVRKEFIRPVLKEDLRNVYLVDSFVMTDDVAKGITYAEIICLDYLICGMVFNTWRNEIYDVCSAFELEWLNEYSADVAEQYFKMMCERRKRQPATEFKRLLGEFLKKRDKGQSENTDEDL